MASVTYSGSFGGVAGSNGLTSTSTSCTGSPLPSNAVITGVTYTLNISAGGYSSSCIWNLSSFAVGGQGGSPYTYSDATMYDNEYTFSGNMAYNAADVGKFTGNSITVYANAYTTHSSTSYLWGWSITVNYQLPGSCSAPTTVSVAASTVDAGTSTNLSWSGAKAGSYNSITSYKVYRSTSASGTYSLLSTLSASTVSLTVTAPSSMGSSYYYKVAVVDKAYGNEVWSSAYATLTARTYTACTAPTSVSVSGTNVAPGAKMTLKWSGAAAGTNNAIAGYEIYRSTSSGSGYTKLTTVGSTSTSGSTTVTAPTTNGTAYYYKVLTVGTKSGYNSGQSTAYATLSCSFAAVGAPNTLKLDLTNVAPNAEATLSWSGASAGNNNAITGYEVHAATAVDGSYSLLTTVSTSATSGSATVNAPAENGTTYYYKVKTLGTLSGSDSALSDTYTSLTCTYSAPNAPTAVSVGGESALYVEPGATLSLIWSGASAGANNPIVGYDIYRDGVLYVSGLSDSTTSYDVSAHDTAGNSYKFTVVTKGAYSDSAQSLACVLYSYTDPTAPTELTVSNALPATGARVLLSWKGAAPGGYNDIVGYRVYRSATEGGTLTHVASVEGADTAMSCYVTAPSMVGAFYYFRVATVGSYSVGSVSDMSIAVGAREIADDDSVVDVIVPPPTRYPKRGFVFDSYDTAARGWTLAGWEFPEPEAQTNYVEVPGRSKGPLDMSTALTDGDPRYNGRELTVSLECSDGTRLEREVIISEMVNRLNGMRVDIIFPDDRTHYATGRLHVKKEYNDMAHAAVTVTATCDPWRYSRDETRFSLLVIEEPTTTILPNNGRRVIVPDVVVTGYGARVYLTCGEHEWVLGTGTHKLPEFALQQGNTVVTYHGVGTVNLTYREAIL